ncbi:MAG: class I mannose-6-phosphate isomerase [Treponema sp.]|jgi:mannose-6-phosphate isomerase|nr:class I mannose-6-phosphate isomerase [Treponema sp.]
MVDNMVDNMVDKATLDLRRNYNYIWSEFMYYPVMFEPIYKKMIWGGNRLEEIFGRKLPSQQVGESWDISCRPDEMGIVKNGQFIGITFRQLIDKDPLGFLGKALEAQKEFPLLVKLIDANADLSVQVHPPAEKNEVWYIIHAPKGAFLNVGLITGTQKEHFAAVMGSSKIEKYLNFIPVKPGDVINIPAGTVHALNAGLVVAEIQQNSNTTYRIYDYGRVDANGKPRELHLKEALASIDFDARCGLLQGQAASVSGGKIVHFCTTRFYALYEYNVETTISEKSDPERFFIFTCIKGCCDIITKEFCTTVTAGDSVFIPAALGEYELKGKCRLLKSFVPGV